MAKISFFFPDPPEQRCKFGASEDSALAFINISSTEKKLIPKPKKPTTFSFFFFLWLFDLNQHMEKSNKVDIGCRGKKAPTHQCSLILLLLDFISDYLIFIPPQISHFISSLYGITRRKGQRLTFTDKVL